MRQSSVIRILLVLAYAALIYLPFLGSGRALTTHEGFVSVPALHILKTGNWLIPKYVAWVWVEKPPFAIWLTAASFGVFGGFGELAARLPSALSAMALCGLLAWFAHRTKDHHTGLLAGLVQATCLYAFVQGRLGETDFPFVFLIAGAHVVLGVNWVSGPAKLPIGSACLMHTFVGLAVLTKGPLALALISSTILMWCVLQRDWRPLAAVVWTPGVICSIGPALLWHALAVGELGTYAIERWVYNYVDRATGEHRLGARSIFYYFWMIPYAMLPWSIVLLISWRRLVQDWHGPDVRLVKFLWCWFLAGALLLTLAAGKSTHYCYPVLPPLSILAAMCLRRLEWSTPPRRRSIVMIGFAAGALAYAACAGLLIPYLDHWRATADFVRRTTSRAPAGARLILVGLGHSPAYPYVARDYEYLDSMNDVAMLLERDPADEIWILALRCDVEQESRVHLAEVETESSRPRHPEKELLTSGVAWLGRISGARADQ